MRRATVAMALAVAGCSPSNSVQPPAEAYRHFGDRLQVRLSPFGGQPCGTLSAPPQQPVDYASCYRVGPPKTMRGILYRGALSDAHFYGGLAELPKDGFWAEGASVAVSDRYVITALREPRTGRAVKADLFEQTAYRVEFVGRETATFPSRRARSVVIIERIDAIVRLEQPRDPNPRVTNQLH